MKLTARKSLVTTQIVRYFAKRLGVSNKPKDENTQLQISPNISIMSCDGLIELTDPIVYDKNMKMD